MYSTCRLSRVVPIALYTVSLTTRQTSRCPQTSIPAKISSMFWLICILSCPNPNFSMSPSALPFHSNHESSMESKSGIDCSYLFSGGKTIGVISSSGSLGCYSPGRHDDNSARASRSTIPTPVMNSSFTYLAVYLSSIENVSCRGSVFRMSFSGSALILLRSVMRLLVSGLSLMEPKLQQSVATIQTSRLT